MPKSLALIHIISAIVLMGAPVTMAEQELTYIDPTAGEPSVLQLDQYHMSTPRFSAVKLDEKSVGKLFDGYELKSLKRKASENWNNDSMAFWKDDTFAFSVDVYSNADADEADVRQKISAQFLGISGPINNLRVTKNAFSDYTASLDDMNNFVVSARGNVVVKCVTNTSAIDCLKINQQIMETLAQS